MSLFVDAQQRRITVRGGAAERGSAGMFVHIGSGPWRVTARIRVSRLAWASDLEFGLGALGGALGAEGPTWDPVAEIRFNCSGGEGDLRHEVSLQTHGPSGPSAAPLASFELVDDLECTLACGDNHIRAAIRTRGRPGTERRTELPGTLPEGHYVLGSLPRVGQGAAVDATIELLTTEGSIDPMDPTAIALPTWLHDPDSGLQTGPLAEILGPLNSDSPWKEAAPGVSQRIEQLRGVVGTASEGESWPPRAWFEVAAQRKAPAEERSTHIVAPLVDEIERAMTQRATFPDDQAKIRDWMGPGLDLDLGPARRSALLFHLASASHDDCRKLLEQSLTESKSSFIAEALLTQLGQDAPPNGVLIDYFSLPAADAGLATRYCAVLHEAGHFEAAVSVARSALKGGACDGRFGEVIQKLPTDDRSRLREEWSNSREEGLQLLQGLMQRQRWMGLAGPAGASARTLVRLHATRETVRAAIPTLLLAGDRQTLSDLLQHQDPEIRAAAAEGLDDDPLLVHLRSELLMTLDHD